ncbi:hypothetical protein AX17_005427 [Amanita inopinata Kibby_2008]|nr:hypothetical protein AX17_005427 [Amanita inopinata Kibby_2008]
MDFDVRRVKQLIYGGEIYSEEDYECMLEKLDDFPRDSGLGCRKPSLYLQLFEDMINMVYEHESHLLSQNEWDVFATFKCYCYNARYCLVRLVLRKPDQWHALSTLSNYKKEVGEVGLIRAVTDLCRPWSEVINATADDIGPDANVPQRDEDGIVDSTCGVYNEANVSISCQNAYVDPGPSTLNSLASAKVFDVGWPAISESPQESLQEAPLDSFCHDESVMDTTELLSRLSVKQLKDLIKATRSKPVKFTKPEMIRALLANAMTQSVLDFSASLLNEKKGGDSNSGLRQMTLPFAFNVSAKGKEKAVPRNQEQRLIQMALQVLGKCVKVNGDFHRLVRRLHLIYFRCTEHPTSLLLPALLTSFKKRSYPQYTYVRDKSIWPTREDLLAYERALELEAELEEISIKLVETSRELKAPAPAGSSVLVTPSKNQATPFKNVTPANVLYFTPTTELEDRAENTPNVVEHLDVEEEEMSIRKAKKVKELLYEKIYPKWQRLIDAKCNGRYVTRKPGLERFEPGYIYTRMLHHALRSLATLKEYEEEHRMLQALLDQRFYLRGSRARWYERRAIIQMTYLCKREGRKRDHEVLRQAMEGVKEALMDEDTGIVWRPGLFRRLQRLEKMLRIPDEERAQCEGELKQPKKVFVKAIKVTKRAKIETTEAGQQASTTTNHVNVAESSSSGLHSYFTPKKTAAEEVKVENTPEDRANIKAKAPSWKGKSLWIGKDNEEVHVEIRALQYYETLGFKGLHAETRILTTVFSLLFWDIIFADIPGAFETPYQIAPLDLAEDTFYHARKDSIEARLEEISNGQARDILERHGDQQTMCIGVRWDICERPDLVEIVECLGGCTLSLICRLFCEDYGGRSSGVPDLIVWNAGQGICKFVEVKGPGDRPQENQKLWFDSLLRAGALVEICHIIDTNAPPKEKWKTPGTGRKRKALTAQLDLHNELEDDKGEDWQQLRDGDLWVPAGGDLPDIGKGESAKRRKRQAVAEDELPSCFPSVADIMSPGRLVRQWPVGLSAAETPSKRRREADL